MKLSELIAAYGDDEIGMQILDRSITSLSAGRNGNKITFGSEQPIGVNGTERMGIVVWLDRDRVTEVIAASKQTAAIAKD